MKRFILGLIVAISLPVMAAVLWPSGAYLETFQNGFIFGSGKVLSALNDVITFDDKRLDDGSKQIIIQEDYEGAKRASDFTCGANLTATDETALPINGAISIDIDQGATPTTDGFGCSSSAYTLPIKAKGKFLGACIYTKWDGNDNEFSFRVFDNTNLAFLGSVGITASTEPKEHCLYFNSATDTASIDFFLVADTANNNTTLRLDDVQLVVDPLAPTDIYASSKPELYTPVTQGFGALASSELFWSRDGAYLIIQGTFDPGTGTAVEAQLGLPDGLVIDDGSTSIVNVGSWVVGSAGTQSRNGGILWATAGDTYLNFSSDAVYSGTVNFPTSFKNGDAGVAPNDPHYIRARVPIAGWSNTAQGVVVKNRTDSASVENSFSVKISSTGVASDPNIDNWYDGVTKPATGLYNIDVTSLGLSSAMNCQPAVGGTGTFGFIEDCDIDFVNTTNTTIVVRCHTDGGAGAASDRDFILSCQKAKPDFIKETDKVYTVDVSQLKGSYLVASGNAGTSLTANVTNIDFANETIDDANAWSGTIYTAPKFGYYNIEGTIDISGASSVYIFAYINGVKDVPLGVAPSAGEKRFSGLVKLSEGDTLSFRTDQSITLANSTTHSLTIKGNYGDKSVYIGTFGQPTCYFERSEAEGTQGGTYTTGAWQKRNLNISSGSCSFASLSSGVITIKAGGYETKCDGMAFRIDNFIHRLRNTTDGTTAVLGMIGYSPSTANSNNNAPLAGAFSINGSKNFELQINARATRASDGLGTTASGLGVDYKFSYCKITKVR